MSGLLDAVAHDIHDTQCAVGDEWNDRACELMADGEPNKAMRLHIDGFEAEARAAVEAVAAWLDPEGANRGGVKWAVATLLRAEVAPPRPTPEDVIYRAIGTHGVIQPHVIVDALRDAGMLREDTP